MLLNDSSINDLYYSTVRAFPRTQKRQHSIDLVKITEIKWTPYLGMKTLFIKGLAQSEESHKEYTPIIVFKNVIYHNENTNKYVKIIANDNKEYIFEQLDYNENDVLVRCQCKDFFWRLQHTDYVDHSLYSKNRKKYEARINPGSANPLELPGMCKHLLKLAKVIKKALEEG